MNLHFKSGSGIEVETDSMPYRTSELFEFYRILSQGIFNGYSVKIFSETLQNDSYLIEKQKIICGSKPKSLIDSELLIYSWPKDTVSYGSNIVGTINPAIPNLSISFQELCNEKLKTNIKDEWNEKFNRESSTSIPNRINLCSKLCEALKIIENENSIALVDLNPQNIFITLTGQVILDVFSNIQFTPTAKDFYYGDWTQEKYLPPESNNLDIQKNIISKTWDRFSLAVILYEILIGAHPFSTHNSGKYKDITGYKESIANGLYKQEFDNSIINIDANEKERYNLLSEEIKTLFTAAFVQGHSDPKLRPSPSQWIDAFNGIDSYSIVENNEIAIQNEVDSQVKSETKTEMESYAETESLHETDDEDIDENVEKGNIVQVNEDNKSGTEDGGNLTIQSENPLKNNNEKDNGPDYKDLSGETKSEDDFGLKYQNSLKEFCITNKGDLRNQIVFESFVKRLWDRIDLLSENEYISIDNIFIEKFNIKRGVLPKYLGFSPIDFKVEFKKVEYNHSGKQRATQEIDDVLLEQFGQVYQKLIS